MPPAKKAFVVVRPFHRDDTDTDYEPGDPYTGPDADLYLAWPDDFGPLITESAPPDGTSDDRKGR